jgi:hypothetical protein
LDTSALIAIFKPQIDGLVGWALMMQMGAGEVGEEEARSSKKQVDTVMEGLTALFIGATLSDEGVGLRVTTTAKPGTELGRQTQHTVATAPLLRGLPRRNYLAVFGQELHPAALSAALPGLLGPVFTELRKETESDGEKINSIQKEITQALQMIRAVRGSIDHLTAGPDGMIAASLVIEINDSAAWLDLVTKTGARLAELAVTESENEDEEKDLPLDHWVKWTPQAGQVEGLPVSELFIDILKDQELDEEEIQGIKTVLGAEGMTLRLATVDPRNVALTLGGGSQQMARLIRAVRRDNSPLDDDTAIAHAASVLPREKAGVAFLALDRMVNFIHGVAEECETEEPFPFWLPRVDAPLAISITGGDGWSRHDFFAPMPLLAGVVSGMRSMEFHDPSDDEEETGGDGLQDEGGDDDLDDDQSDDH